MGSGTSTAIEDNQPTSKVIKFKLDSTLCHSIDNIVGLRTLEQNYSIDYNLISKYREISYLKPDEKLELIFRNGSKMAQKHLQNISNYDILCTIGKGGFSKVYIVRCQITGGLYAMKSMNKSTIKKWQKYDYIMNEKHILSITSHPFIVESSKYILAYFDQLS